MVRISVIVVSLPSLMGHGCVTSPVGWQVFFFPLLLCTSIMFPKIHPSFCITMTAVSLPCYQGPFFISGKGRFFFFIFPGLCGCLWTVWICERTKLLRNAIPGVRSRRADFPTCLSCAGAGRILFRRTVRFWLPQY